MSTPADDALERRVSSLEREVTGLRERVALSSSDAAASRVLAADADRDVSEVRAELRAHTSALNALRETQLEQGVRLNGVEGRLDGVEGRLDSLETEVRTGFATMGAGMAEITGLLNQLIERD